MRYIFLLFISGFLISCSGSRTVSDKNPDQSMSVVFNMTDASNRSGIVIKTDESSIHFVDSQTHKLVWVNKSKINSINLSDKIYDMEGFEISEQEINKNKRMAKTIGYAVGGTVLGAAAGFGVGIAAKNFLFPMIAGAVAGGTWFGLVGSTSDRNTAIDKIRASRFEKSKDRLEKEMKETKEFIRRKTKEKERLQKEINDIEKKKSDSGEKKDE